MFWLKKNKNKALHNEPDIAGELAKQIRAIALKSKFLSSRIRKGEYQQLMRGNGMHFKEVRAYQLGDDPRSIDWNVTARMQQTHAKVFEEERGLEVCLITDVSASMQMGTNLQTKRRLAAEIAGILSLSIINNKDKVGLITYAANVVKYIVPSQKKQQPITIISNIIAGTNANKKSNLIGALQFVKALNKHNCCLVIISDFLCEDYKTLLQQLARKNKIIGIQLVTALDMQIPNIGDVYVQDIETRQIKLLTTNDKKNNAHYKANFTAFEAEAIANFASIKSPLFSINTNDDVAKKLQEFFS